MTDFTPTPIPQKIRLGHQMEYVFKQLLGHCPQYEVLVHNLPIRNGKQTIGEIDFILRDVKTQQLIHVELTNKFYIIDTTIAEPLHQLIGPNKRDAFFMKMEKIKSKQFTLLHTESGTKALADLDIDASKLVHQTCFKAQLFKPFKTDTLQLDNLNENCIVGYWLRMADLKTDVFKNYQFYIPYKSQWVLEPHENVEWTTHFETLLEINLRILKRNAPLVWMKKSDTEFGKFFVVWW